MAGYSDELVVEHHVTLSQPGPEGETQRVLERRAVRGWVGPPRESELVSLGMRGVRVDGVALVQDGSLEVGDRIVDRAGQTWRVVEVRRHHPRHTRALLERSRG